MPHFRVPGRFRFPVTRAEWRTLVGVFTGDSGSGGTTGLVPAPAAGDAAAGKFLKADGTYAVPVASAFAASRLSNIGLAVSASGNALTIALKDAAGSDPSAGSPVIIDFPNVTPTTGTPSTITQTAAASLVLSSGSTLGVTSSTAFRLWIVAFNDGGTLRLGAILPTTFASAILTIYPLQSSGIASSTAEGGAGAADSAQTFYTGTAVSSKSYVVIGFVEWGASGLTAGTWTTTNLSRIGIYGPGVRLPGDVVQAKATTVSGSSASSTTWVDVTGSTLSMTLSSACNLVSIRYDGRAQATAGGAGTNSECLVRLARGGSLVTSASGMVVGNVSAAGSNLQTDGTMAITGVDRPNNTSANSYTLQVSSLNTATVGVYSAFGIAQELAA